MVHKETVTLPIYDQFGTEANIDCISTRWAPRKYSRYMFGPGVDEAIDRYIYSTREFHVLLQLSRAQREIIFKFDSKQGPKMYERDVTMPDGTPKTIDVYNDTVIRYSNRGRVCESEF